MKYLLALVCPPLALIACGKVYQAFFNAGLAFLWLCVVFAPLETTILIGKISPAALALILIVFNGFFGPLITVLHALFVVAHTTNERRHRELLEANRVNAIASRPQILVMQGNGQVAIANAKPVAPRLTAPQVAIPKRVQLQNGNVIVLPGGVPIPPGAKILAPKA